jgi:hypothetical protein
MQIVLKHNGLAQFALAAGNGRNMARRQDNISVILARCDALLKTIEKEYNASLHAKHIEGALKIDIKNFCENLRSALDYLAHEIRETYCPSADAKAKFYFPVLPSRPEFEGQMAKWYPGLDTNAPDVWAYLESTQPYHDPFCWLGSFNRVNNENKHGNLVEQVRTETEQIRVSFPGGQVSWTPGSVRFGSGVSIGGVPVDPRTQVPIPHPSQTVQRITWVDFRFAGEDVSALALLTDTLRGVGQIVEVTANWL